MKHAFRDLIGFVLLSGGAIMAFFAALFIMLPWVGGPTLKFFFSYLDRVEDWREARRKKR